MVARFQVTFPAKEGPSRRRAYLYLPACYGREPERRFPVLYMFDGHNVFFDGDATYGKSWGMKEYLDRTGDRLIVAAVECSNDPNLGRLREYSPYDFYEDDIGQVEALGDETLDWFIHSFKRSLDSALRTLPDREHTFIAGSSMGGLMSLYAVLRFNKVFARGAALSPSLWTSPERLENLAATAPLEPGTVVYLDCGDRELGFRPGIPEQLERMNEQLRSRGVRLVSRIIPGGEHNETSWEKQLPFMIGTLLS